MSFQIRLNWLIASVENMMTTMKASTPQPVISQLTMDITVDTTSTLTINFKSIPYSSFSVNLTSDLSNIIFQKPVLNGYYTLYIYGTGQIVRKHLGTNIMTNLKGDIMINGVFSVNVHYDGTNYMMNFTNYTF